MNIYTFNSKVLTRNTKWLKEYEEPMPPTPSLPPYTIRMKFTEGVTPSFSNGTATQVSSSPNVWDLTYENSDWSNLLYEQADLLEVIAANTTGVSNMSSMFQYCRSLISVPLFDTSRVYDMGDMFHTCEMLTYIPLFDTSNVTNIAAAFRYCYDVQSGALALYQQASSQPNPPWSHDGTFDDCGYNTVTGTAERAQIPTSWGGTAS